MGAYEFMDVHFGDTAEKAFRDAVEAAEYEHGHGGYSGTIAEKSSFVMICDKPMADDAAYALARKMLREDDPRVADKWGPAGVIPVEPDPRMDMKMWLIFGLASS
jgi:hypothetical protein